MTDRTKQKGRRNYPIMSKRTASNLSISSVSSSSDVSDTTYNSFQHGKRTRLSSSGWLRSDLEALGVFYDRDPMSMKDFSDMLKQKRKFELPVDIKPFIELTNKLLTFSFNVSNIETSKVRGQGIAPPLEETILCESLEKERVSVDGYDEKFFSRLQAQHNRDDRLAKKLYRHWSCKVDDFLEDCKDLVQWSYRPELFTPKAVTSLTNRSDNLGVERESIYRDLLISWSKVFFLKPKIGDCKQTETLIKDKEVISTHGVRFYAQTNRAKIDPVMLILCEVKPHSAEIPDVDKDVWIAERLSSDSLGQVGIELVTESANSELRPSVLGIIYIGTELMFIFLDIRDDHADAIMTDKSTEGKRAHIRYTKSYNYLKAEDRKCLTEIFFWLGCLQKHNLYTYFLKKCLEMELLEMVDNGSSSDRRAGDMFGPNIVYSTYTTHSI